MPSGGLTWHWNHTAKLLLTTQRQSICHGGQAVWTSLSQQPFDENKLLGGGVTLGLGVRFLLDGSNIGIKVTTYTH